MTEQEYIWQPPEYTKICEALRYFADRRDTITYVTSVMKMRVHSERYRRELLKVIRYCTVFARRVLEALYEELPKKADGDQKQRTTRKPIDREPSDRRAFFFVLTAFQAKEAGSKGHVTDILRDLIAKHMNTYKLRPGDYYFASHVRDAIYKECAVILLNWCAPFIYEAAGHREGAHATPDRLSDEPSDTKPGKKRQDDVRPLPTLEQVYDLWQAWHQDYQAALDERMPFPARYEGKTLQEVGRRGIRWLLAHLHDRDTIEATLWHLDALLGYRAVTNLDEWEEAALFPHPYSKNEKHERRLRVRYVDVQIPEVKGDRVVLGEKHESALERLRDEMLEQQHNREQFAQMKAAAELILFSSTPRYPTIQRPMLAKDDSEREEQERELHAALQRVQNPFPVKKSKKPVEAYEEEELIELENTMLANLLRALHGMELSAYPLPTKRTSNPNRNIYTFDLLYDRETGAYVLALSFHGKGVEYGRRKLAGITGRRPKARKSDAEIMPRFKPQVGENLCYVNAPGVQYQPPKRAQTLMFSLEYGKKHQDMRILQRFMRQRMQSQQPVSSLSTDHTPDDTAEHPDPQELPVAEEAEAADTHSEASETTENEQAAIIDDATAEAEETDESVPQKPSRYKRTNPPIAAVRVVCRWNKQQQPEFFAHFSVPIQVAPCTILPECVLGIHEHDYGYSYALLSLTGEVIEVGDVPVHEHIMPRPGDTSYNPNYAPEVAHAIVELAARHNAYIGLQDTGAKQEVSVSRAHNRRAFGRPSRKIAQIVADHALAAQCEVRHEDGSVHVNGLMKPRLTSDISPARDCAHCGRRMEKKKHGVRDRLYVACPTCKHQQPFREDTDLVQFCDNPACTSTWRARQGFVEQEFVCGQCDAPPMVARYNTAIVTAQRTLEQLVIHHERSSARTRENKPRKQGIKVSPARQLRKNTKQSTS